MCVCVCKPSYKEVADGCNSGKLIGMVIVKYAWKEEKGSQWIF